jgi:4-carboxymuconolactone decarboxylase
MLKMLDVAKVLLIGTITILYGCATVEKQPISKAEYTASLPDDVNPESRGRLPIVNREALDDAGKATYDRYMSPDSTSLAGIQGPGGIRLHAGVDKSPTRIDDKVSELVRLVIAREMDQQFEWTMHEPVALNAGLAPAIIDTIRHRKSLQGVPEMEASIIQMGREIFQEHRVSPETYRQLTNHFGHRDLMEIVELMSGGMNSFFLLFLYDVHLPHDRPSLLPVR